MTNPAANNEPHNNHSHKKLTTVNTQAKTVAFLLLTVWPGEGNGVAYWFVTDDEFDRMIADDGLLEWAVVHGTHRYGTPRRPVEEAVAAGKTVILEIDLQGARQVRTTYPQATHIFLAPPSWDELVRRLQTRGTETSEQQARRLQTAARELEATSEFDEIIVNGELDPTVHKLVELMRL